jgi:hypothetical protein
MRAGRFFVVGAVKNWGIDLTLKFSENNANLDNLQ